MKKWEKLEENVLSWLNKNFSYICHFEISGKSDSTVSDILVTNKITNSQYYIEVKSKISQAGQFVVVYDKKNKLFYWSNLNKSNNNCYSQEIINYMNKYKYLFKDVTEKNLLVNINKKLCFDWIKEFYNQKNVKFFVVPYLNSYLISPIDKIDELFDVEAIYRVKKSGSSSLPRRDFDKLKSLIQNYKFIEINNKYYTLVKNKIINNKTHVDENDYYYRFVDNFIIPNYEDHIIYELRKLSKTRNPNVIFKINVKSKLNINLKNDDIANMLKEA